MQGLGEATEQRVRLSKKVMDGELPSILNHSQTVAEAGLENLAELSAILLPYPESVQDERSITLRIKSVLRDDDIFFRVKGTTRFDQIINAFAAKVGVNVFDLRFMYDGDRVNWSATPNMLELEEGDQIDAYLAQWGD
jgi:Ubiquitin-2 like Rad60 SUMO-like